MRSNLSEYKKRHPFLFTYHKWVVVIRAHINKKTKKKHKKAKKIFKENQENISVRRIYQNT
jgi:RecA-family ATPase